MIRIITFVITIIFFASSMPFCEEMKGQVSIENSTGKLLGVRIQSPKRGVESFELLDVGEKKDFSCNCDKFWISTQMITDSKHVVCCEWFRLDTAGVLEVVSNETGTRCSCKIKNVEKSE